MQHRVNVGAWACMMGRPTPTDGSNLNHLDASLHVTCTASLPGLRGHTAQGPVVTRE
jgi:hypothetical protein